MTRLAIAALLAAAVAAPANADIFVPVKDEDQFVSLIDGKELRNFLYGVTLNVYETGQIQGEAWGWDITGSWTWQDGYFCREMAWGDDPIPYNCQLVEVRADNRMRFTVDQGAGDSATFRLR
ncbi:MAG: dihydrodipicolinate reductase [Pseudomonadota bacterium]